MEKTVYNVEEAKKGTDPGRWIQAARQTALARREKKQDRMKQKAKREEQNERLRTMIHRNLGF